MSQWPDNQIPATGNGLPDGNGANGSGGSILSFESRPGFDAASGGFRKITSVQIRAEERTAELIRTCPDREWKTFCLLATRADERGLARLGEDEIAGLLGVSLAAARARVRALEFITFEGRPLIKVKRDRLRDGEHTYVLYTVNFLPLPPQFYQEELFPRTDEEVRAAMEMARAKTEAAAAALSTPADRALNGGGGPRMAAAAAVAVAAAPAASAAFGSPEVVLPGGPAPDRRLKSVYTFAEEKLGRPLSSKEILAIQSWAAEYGFSTEVIKALFDEGFARGKSHLSYLEAVARRWRSEGIHTLADVERSREEYHLATDQYTAVINYLNLGRRLTQAEIELLDKWYKTWGFPSEVILKACSTTVNISNPNFRYIDRVLSNWRRDGIATLADAERTLAEFESGGRGVAATAGVTGPAGAAGPGGSAAGAGGHEGNAVGSGATPGVGGHQPNGGRTAPRGPKGRPLKHYQMTDSGRDEEFYEQFLTRFDKTGKDK